jgi:hypothetical protein
LVNSAQLGRVVDERDNARLARGGPTGDVTPRRAAPATAILLASISVVVPRGALAHAFAQRYDLPVPLHLWVAGAALAVALSFAVIGLFVRAATVTHEYPRLNLLRWHWGRLLLHRSVRWGVQGVSVGIFLLVVAAGVIGHPNPTRNLAPTLVWILWWVGFTYVSALVGNLWAAINPWATLFSWAEWLYQRANPDEPLALSLPYPAWLGVWPAVGLFLTFAWLELISRAAIDPPLLALAIGGYSIVTWAGMVVFGRAVWLQHGDPFALAFEVFARFAPTEIRVTDPAVCARCPVACRDREGACVDCPECFARARDGVRELSLRPFGAGLLRHETASLSMTAFVLTLLATVTFDGFTATPAWEALYNAFAPILQGPGGWPGIRTVGLLAFPALFLAVYGAFSAGMARAAGAPRAGGAVAGAFVFSLVPIAIAYHLAHYFTYLLIQGQRIIPLVSDPLGFGWDLFGTAPYQPDIGIVGARFAWYTAVTAIVVGHIVAVYVAHVVALREFPDPRGARRSQYPMLALMVGYTMVSLWILAQPIVEAGAG